ncbi:MAG: anhydro-N-acetylmuramic acid kinase [Flavobacteriia bacterium]|nr:anhydro-N-acetylmuramic acid kinase [Flavobacteriia bacterium]
MSQYNIIGLMSGTSMDGLDIAYISFLKNEKEKWSFQVIATETFEYSIDFVDELKNATTLSVPKMLILDKKIGQIYAEFVDSFIHKNQIEKSNINLIASHGQTIFHQPNNGFTYQIGCGTTLAFLTGIKVVNDFRTKDVVAGGQGAPLVPIGDFKLFNDQAEAFLNIGGITNVSFKKEGKIIAFDICPGNLPLNKLVESKGMSYDQNGDLASKGEINFFLLDLLNQIEFYKEPYPKSLGTEWLENYFYPLIKFDRDIENNLRTVVEHIAIQIGNILNAENLKSIYITGGGAKNIFLIDKIKKYFNGKVIIPEKQIVDFKEAIIFGFLGALYLSNEPNSIPTVTGASKAVIGGVLHIP